jgi:drug/metabolite transporter (DMT)-like permease
MKLRSDRFGGALGILLCVAGLVLIFLGWNGAAETDRVASQMPYIISGGLAGVALCVIGAGLLVTASARSERVKLQASVEELREALQRTAEAAVVTGGAAASPARGGSVVPDGTVLAGPTAYHVAGCRLTEGQSGLTPMTEEAAKERGLDPCRICVTG